MVGALMAWSTPPTYTSGNVLTAAQMNAISANLNETAPAKATTSTSYFVGSSANAIQERQFQVARAVAPETTPSTSYTELATQQRITVSSGEVALVVLTARLYVGTAGETALNSVVVSGSSSIAADDSYALMQQSSTVNNRIRASAVTLFTNANMGLNSGSNLWKSVYRTTAGTLTAADREFVIMPM